MMAPTLLKTAAVIFISSLCCVEMGSSLFKSGLTYRSKIFNVTGKHIKAGSKLTCSRLCIKTDRCISFSVNSSPANSDCILYENYRCDVTTSSTLVHKDGYWTYCKVSRADEMTTDIHQQEQTASPIQSTTMKYEERSSTTTVPDTTSYVSVKTTTPYKCSNEKSNFNYAYGSECPLGFEFHNRVCYKLDTNIVLNHVRAVIASPNDPTGTRLMKIRDGDNDTINYVHSLMQQNDVIMAWTGLRNNGGSSEETADWRWLDNTTVDSSIWAKGEPNFELDNIAVLVPQDYCWADATKFLLTLGICQAPVAGFNGCPASYTLNQRTQTCYALTTKKQLAQQDYNSFCLQSGGSGVVIQNSYDLNFIANLIKGSVVDGNIFSIGVSYDGENWVNTHDQTVPMSNFNQWCTDQPDYGREACGAFYTPSGQGVFDMNCNLALPQMKEWIATSCSEWKQLGTTTTDGIFLIRPMRALRDVIVNCDMVRDGGGWTVIASKQNPGNATYSPNFEEYRNGINISGYQFWIGLDILYFLTNQENVELMLILTDTNNRLYEIRYSKFRLTMAGNSYTFTVENFHTDNELSDEFSKQQNVPFTVVDQMGGWWFSSESNVNLNGNFRSWDSGQNVTTLMQWTPDVILTGAIMQVRSLYLTKC